MLDPVATLSVVVNALQLVEYTSKVLVTANEIRLSASGASVKHEAIETVYDRLEKLCEAVQQPLRGSAGNTTAVKDEVQKSAEELISRIRGLMGVLNNLKGGKHASRWKSLHLALKSVWKREQIQELEQDLQRWQQELITALLISMREAAPHRHEEVLAEIKRLQISLEARNILEEEFRKQVLTSAMRGPESTLDVPAFMKALQQPTTEALTQEIMDLLHFEMMPNREDAIVEAHARTFSWIWKGAPMEPESSHAVSSDLEPEQMDTGFVEWLRGPRKLYWITGKPGAGKSTLMKYISHHSRTQSEAHHWVKSDPKTPADAELIIASFYFWCSGVEVQKSLDACLRTLLYQILEQRPEAAPKAFLGRFERLRKHGKDRRPLTRVEMIAALQAVLKSDDTFYVLFIDGLDEFEGNKLEIADLVISLSELPHVKLCTASREWTAFQERFGEYPSLRIDELTRNDIFEYAKDHLEKVGRFRDMKATHPDRAEELITNITERASGVFLWVYIVVAIVTNELINGTGWEHIEQLLDELKSDLKDLFRRILNEIEPRYKKDASELLQFHEQCLSNFDRGRDLLRVGSSLILTGWSANRTWVEVQAVPSVAWTPDELAKRCKELRRRLYSRCMCLLESRQGLESHLDGRALGVQSFFVNYLHREVRDYLLQPHIWQEVVNRAPGYDAEEAQVTAHLMCAKVCDDPDDRHMVLRQAMHLAYGIYDSAKGVTWISRVIEVNNSLGDLVQFSRSHPRHGHLDHADPRNLLALSVQYGVDWYVQEKVMAQPELLCQNFEGLDLLSHAAEWQAWRLQQVFLQCGADPHAVCQGKTPWQRFCSRIPSKPSLADLDLDLEDEVVNLIDFLETLVHYLEKPKMRARPFTALPAQVADLLESMKGGEFELEYRALDLDPEYVELLSLDIEAAAESLMRRSQATEQLGIHDEEAMGTEPSCEEDENGNQTANESDGKNEAAKEPGQEGQSVKRRGKQNRAAKRASKIPILKSAVPEDR